MNRSKPTRRGLVEQAGREQPRQPLPKRETIDQHHDRMVARWLRRRKDSPSTHLPGPRGKYVPHQGKRECARRTRRNAAPAPLTQAEIERLALRYPMFQGEETDVTPVEDRFLTTRKDHACAVCWQPFPKGSRVRARTERNNEDRTVKTFYACPPCCEAMATSWSDNGEAITARTRLCADIPQGAAA